MPGPHLLLFDDETARGWEPFASTRPAAELRVGAGTLRERAERALGHAALGTLGAPHLLDFEDPGAAPVLTPDAVPRDAPVLYWCSRALLDWSERVRLPEPPALLTVAGAPAGWYARPGDPVPERFLHELDPAGAPVRSVDVTGRWLEHVWDLVTLGPGQLLRDLLAAGGPLPGELPPGVHLLGDHPVVMGAGTRLEPGVVIDAREGPVWIGDQVEVRAFTRIEGPAAFGPHTRVLGGSLSAVSTGPHTNLCGEVSEATILGYCNKAHDGYLGHAYVGRWVNLGAFTTNSDLKNTYGSVRVWTPAGERDTGAAKIGCFIGDHVKTGIGTLLTTGAVIGAGSVLFGSAMPPPHVPSFSWGEGSDLETVRLEPFLATAEKMMARRGVTLTERGRRYLTACWERARRGGAG